MLHLQYKSCPAEPDIWMRLAKHSDGSTYYQYFIFYVDNALCILVNAEKVAREESGKCFELKEESTGPLKLYLGASLHKVQLDNGATAWAAGSSQYIQAAFTNVGSWVQQNPTWTLPTHATT